MGLEDSEIISIKSGKSFPNTILYLIN